MKCRRYSVDNFEVAHILCLGHVLSSQLESKLGVDVKAALHPLPSVHRCLYVASRSLYPCMLGWSEGISIYGLVSQLPSLTSCSQQDGPGDVGAEDPGARGSDSLHHSPTTWQFGSETVLPQWHDVANRRPPQHGLVCTLALGLLSSLCIKAFSSRYWHCPKQPWPWLSLAARSHWAHALFKCLSMLDIILYIHLP
jgi:hypothetical protein